MKYQLSIVEQYETISYCVNVTSNGVDFSGFTAVVGNPSYDQFLLDTDLTDNQVKLLTKDEWFEL